MPPGPAKLTHCAPATPAPRGGSAAVHSGTTPGGAGAVLAPGVAAGGGEWEGSAAGGLEGGCDANGAHPAVTMRPSAKTTTVRLTESPWSRDTLRAMSQTSGAAREAQRHREAYGRRVRWASEAVVFGLAAIFAGQSLFPETGENDRIVLQLTALLVVVAGWSWFGLVPRGLFGAWRVFVACCIA